MYRWVDEQGHVHFTATPPTSRGTLQEFKVDQPNEHDSALEPSALPMAEPGLIKFTSNKPAISILAVSPSSRRLGHFSGGGKICVYTMRERFLQYGRTFVGHSPLSDAFRNASLFGTSRLSSS
jgi:hypothetical protein